MIKSQIRVNEQEQQGAKVNGPGSKGDDEEGTMAKGWLLIGRETGTKVGVKCHQWQSGDEKTDLWARALHGDALWFRTTKN